MLVQPPLSPLSGVFLLAAGLLLVVALVAVRASARSPVTDWFLLLLGADAAWAVASVVPLEAGVLWVAFVGEVARVGASAAAALAWFGFAVVYTGRQGLLTRRRFAALVAPLVVHVLALATNPVHGLSIRGLSVSVAPVTTTVGYSYGPVYAVAAGYALVLVVVGTGLVAQAAVDTELYVDQSIALIVAASMPIAGTVVTLSGAVEVGVTDLTPATLPITAVGLGYALFRSDLLTTGPLIASEGREVAVESLEEGFLIVDGNGQVVEANTAACELLASEDLAGATLDAALPVGDVPEEGRRTVRTDDGAILEAQVTSLTHGDRRGVGRVVTLRDVTGQRRRRERLQVLNRVLRHNLRNDLNIVRGLAGQMAKGNLDGPDAEAAAVEIRDQVDDLLAVAENARRLERLLDANQTVEREPVALAALVESRVDRLREKTDQPVDATTDLPVECHVQSSRSVLEMVIDELLDNAVRHNNGPEPTVLVSAVVDGSVRLRVEDDGPGIPDQDREAVLSGSETPLEHGSRFGLWMVRWGVRYLGGTIAIRDRAPTGTVVEFTLPTGAGDGPADDRVDAVGGTSGEDGPGPADAPAAEGGTPADTD